MSDDKEQHVIREMSSVDTPSGRMIFEFSDSNTEEDDFPIFSCIQKSTKKYHVIHASYKNFDITQTIYFCGCRKITEYDRNSRTQELITNLCKRHLENK